MGEAQTENTLHVCSWSLYSAALQGPELTPKNRYLWLDLVRGLSAMAVCAGHLRAVVFVDYAQLHSVSLPLKVFYAMTGLGHQAVMVFFVLSGFFVGGSILKKRESFRWSDYATARLARLWIVLIPALAATFLVDRLIGSFAPDVLYGKYFATWNSGPVPDSSYSSGLLTFLGNMLFLQTILTPVFGTNAPLWSLANEFWYYVLFPLCAFAGGLCYYTRKPSILVRVVVGLIALVVLLWLPPSIRSGYWIWLLGVLVYMALGRIRRVSYPVVVLTAAVFGASLVYSKAKSLQATIGISSDVVVGLGFCLFCFSIAVLPAPRILSSLIVKISRFLSEISYSLYLSHFPFVVLLGTLFYAPKPLEPTSMAFLQYIAWLLVLLLIGGAFWWLFESRTNILREAIRRRISFRSSYPAQGQVQ